MPCMLFRRVAEPKSKNRTRKPNNHQARENHRSIPMSCNESKTLHHHLIDRSLSCLQKQTEEKTVNREL